MFKRKKLTLLGFLVVLAMLFAACGGDAQPTEAPVDQPDEPVEEPVEEPTEEEPVEEEPVEEPTEEEPAEEEPTEEEPAAEGDGVTVTVLAGNVGQELALTQAAAERYMEQNPNVTVEVVDAPNFVQDRL